MRSNTEIYFDIARTIVSESELIVDISPARINYWFPVRKCYESKVIAWLFFDKSGTLIVENKTNNLCLHKTFYLADPSCFSDVLNYLKLCANP